MGECMARVARLDIHRADEYDYWHDWRPGDVYIILLSFSFSFSLHSSLFIKD